jgi:rhamnogalacturonyl hydrolase YesR
MLLVLGSTACGRNIEPTQAMQDASVAWLTLVDEGDFEASWEQASTIFRSGVTKSYWLATIQSLREPVGRFRGRALRSVIAKTDPANSPPGEYILMTFDSSFEHTQEVVETLTMFQEEDGTWRTAGYFIK